MITKTFLASTMEEAQQWIAQEMGPSAIILTSRSVRPKGLRLLFSTNKIEVTAAVDEQDWEEFQLGKNEYSPELAHMESAKGIILDMDEINKETVMPTLSTIQARLKENKEELKNLLSSMTSTTHLPDSQNFNKTSTGDLFRLANELVTRFENIAVTTSQPHQGEEEYLSSASTLTGTVRFLVSKGIARKIAEQIESKLNQQFGLTDMSVDSETRSARIHALKKELAHYIKTFGPISLTPGQPTFAAIVGPTGVGKTTTLVKIGTQYKHQLNKHVILISLGENRAGAEEHIMALSEKYQLPFVYAPHVNELQEVISAHPNADLVLIDTAGRNQYQWEQIDDLTEILSTIGPLHIHLAISSTTKDIDVYGTIHHFSRLNIESLIFTKLDETIAHGILVNACFYANKPISYLTTGPAIPEDLKIADPDEIARSILTRHNAPEFDELRQLALKSYEA